MRGQLRLGREGVAVGGMGALVAVRVGRRAAVLGGGVPPRVLVAVLGGSSGRSAWCGPPGRICVCFYGGRTMFSGEIWVGGK